MSRGDARDDERSPKIGGHPFFALLFIRAVDHPISHADICLSKITFLLMPANNVPHICWLIGAAQEGREHSVAGYTKVGRKKMGKGGRS